MKATCDICARERQPQDIDYSLMQTITGGPLGWYSGSDGEFCGACLTSLMRKANG